MKPYNKRLGVVTDVGSCNLKFEDFKQGKGKKGKWITLGICVIGRELDSNDFVLWLPEDSKTKNRVKNVGQVVDQDC